MPGRARSRRFILLAAIELAVLIALGLLWFALSRRGSPELEMEQGDGFCACFLDGCVPIRTNGTLWSIEGELVFDVEAALQALGERLVRARTEPEEGDGPRLYLVFPDDKSSGEAWAAIRHIAKNVPPTTLRLTTGDRWWAAEDWGMPLLLPDTPGRDDPILRGEWPTARLDLTVRDGVTHVTTDVARANDGPLAKVASALVEALDVSEDQVVVRVAADVPYGKFRRLVARFADADFMVAWDPTSPEGEIQLHGWPRTGSAVRRVLRGLEWPVAGQARTELRPDEEETIEGAMGLGRAFFVRGREIEIGEKLENHLWRRADLSREGDPPYASKVRLALIADARLPWRDLLGLLRIATGRNVRIRNLIIRVRERPGGPRARIRVRLPVHGENVIPPSFLHVALRPGDPASQTRVALAGGGGPETMISASPDVPFGEIVRAMDVVLADGDRTITLELTPSDE